MKTTATNPELLTAAQSQVEVPGPAAEAEARLVCPCCQRPLRRKASDMPDVLTRIDMAEFLGLEESWVVEHIRDRYGENAIPHFKPGKQPLFRIDDKFWKWLERQRRA